MRRAERNRRRRNPRSCPSTAASGRCAARSWRSARNAAPALRRAAECTSARKSSGHSLSRHRGQKRVGVLRQHAGLLRLGAGVDLDEQQRLSALACRSPSPAPRTGLAGRPNGWRRTAPPLPWPCSIASGPIRCSSRPGCFAMQRPAIWPWPPARGFRRTRAGRRRSPARSPRPECLRHRDQRYRRNIAAGILAGTRDVGADLFETGCGCGGGHALAISQRPMRRHFK